MPLAGVALVHVAGMTSMQVQMQLVLLATVASLASNLGSIPAYWGGARGGRPMVERYGSWLLLSRRDLDRVDYFFAKYGSITVLVDGCCRLCGRLSRFRRGVAKMNQARFHIYTFVGSWPWCYVLAYVGMRLGASWNSNPQFKAIFHRFHLGWREFCWWGWCGSWCRTGRDGFARRRREAGQKNRPRGALWEKATGCCGGAGPSGSFALERRAQDDKFGVVRAALRMTALLNN